MALIERHPDVEDYILEMPMREIVERGGAADLIEGGRVVIVTDQRLNVDFTALEQLSRSLDHVDDPDLRRHIKKLEAPTFFEGPPASRWRTFKDPVRRALLKGLCRGDAALFNRTAEALRHAHEEALRIFDACFPGYDAYRLVPSVRLTRTLFENLHWDDHSIDDDFHQARVFANLDTRPRIWQLSHQFPTMVRMFYEEHDLARFAGKDPNEMLFYINSEILGGTQRKWRDHLPRHRVAFEPGEIWLGESRLVSHQIYYGEAALVYMWFVRASSMADSRNRFNARIERLHEEMRAGAATARS